ncbi:MAG: WXG100 family type VII secretion target [Lachnospiraceae bacterium]|nr:WXG100 family type VII secretion target [Lachnospiraceae bacterium]
MAQLLVTSAELRATASTLRDYNSSFKSQVENLVSSEGSLRTQWQGAANDTFHKAFMDDKGYMDRFAAEIEKYCQTLETIATNYENAENANVDTARTRKY